MMKRLVYVAAIILISFLSLSSHVLAQEVTLSAYPSINHIMLQPQSTGQVDIAVDNTSDPTFISLSMKPFHTDEHNNIHIDPVSSPPFIFSLDSEGKDLQFGQPFLLKSHEGVKVSIGITPTTEVQKDYYYALVAETQPFPGTEGETTARFKVQVAALILVTVTSDGQIETKGTVTLFDIPTHRSVQILGRKIALFDSSEAIPVLLTVQNQGKNVIEPQSTLLLRKLFGSEKRYLITREMVLAHSQKTLTVPNSDTCIQTSCSSPYSLVIKNISPGIYTLYSSVSFSPYSSIVYASTTFCVLPFKMLLVFLILLVALAIFIRKNILSRRST